MADFAIRGVMLDPARLTEKRRVYRDLIPLLAHWGYNTIFWHFADDQGCALRFPRRPELGGPHAYTAEEMRALVRHAARHGLRMIPEVEAFGHTEFITRLARYAHLRDGAEGKVFGAMCPFHRDARAVLRDILTDTAEVFDPEYIHVGLDEVGFGDHPLSRRLLGKKKKHELFADHVCWLHSVVTGLGRKMMMWGDHLLGAGKVHGALDGEALSRRIAVRIPKDIVICDWHYRPAPDPETLSFLTGRGFRVVACPATFAWGSIGHPREWNLRNIRDFCRIAAKARKRGVIGVNNTVWCPWRYFTGTTFYAMALGAAQERTGGRTPKDFAVRFVRETFGIASAKPVVEALRLLHRYAPNVPLARRALPCEASELEGLTRQERTKLAKLEDAAERAAAHLVRARKGVRKHAVYFDDLLFTARVFARCAGRPARLAALRCKEAEAAAHRAAGRAREALALLRAVRDGLKAEAHTARALHRKGLKLWRRTRFDDDPRRDGRRRYARTSDALMQRLLGSAKVLERMARAGARRARTGRGRPVLPADLAAR